jgi:hypothetical protein
MTKRRGMPPTDEPGMAGDFADEVSAFSELKRYETDSTTRDAMGRTTLESSLVRRGFHGSSLHPFYRSARAGRSHSGRGLTARDPRSMRRRSALLRLGRADMRGPASGGVRRRSRRHVFEPAVRTAVPPAASSGTGDLFHGERASTAADPGAPLSIPDGLVADL